LFERPSEDPRPSDLALLDEVALNAGTYEHLLAGVTEVVSRMLGIQLCGVMLWDRSDRTLQMLPGSFGAPAEVTASYRVRDDDARSNAARVFSSGRPFISNTAKGDQAILQDYVTAFKIGQLMTIPLGIGSRRTGVLHFANRETPFDQSDIRVGRRIALRVAIVVEYVTRLVILRHKERLEANLARTAERIAAGAQLVHILPPALHDLIEMSGAGCAAYAPRAAAPIIRRGLFANAAVERDFLATAASHPGSAEERLAHPSRAGDPGSAAIHVPVFVSEERIGTLSLLRMGAGSLMSDERVALARLADLIALAWVSERYQQERAAIATMRERERIADDLHDRAAQILFSGKLALETLLDEPDMTRSQREGVARARDLLAAGEAAIRDAVTALSAESQQTLIERIERLVLTVEDQFGIAVHLEPCGAQLPAAADVPHVAGIVLRVCREALVNAAKHAGPSRVSVKVCISRRHRLVVTVTDDGIGVPAHVVGTGHGLPTLRRAVRDHGGTLRISRGELGGTRVTASLVL
jgi:signal transduction histidine kinase